MFPRDPFSWAAALIDLFLDAAAVLERRLALALWPVAVTDLLLPTDVLRRLLVPAFGPPAMTELFLATIFERCLALPVVDGTATKFSLAVALKLRWLWLRSRAD